MRPFLVVLTSIGALSAATVAVDNPSHGIRVFGAVLLLGNAFLAGWLVRSLPR